MTQFYDRLENLKQPRYLTGLIALIAFNTALAHIFTALYFEINWDEFFYLEWVYLWREGRLDHVLQTIFLRAFTWLPFIGENEAHQIIAGRLVMLGLLTANCTMLWSVSRRFYTARATALALLTFLSFSFVLRHATSFRADMLVTTLCVSVLWLIMKKQLSTRHLILAGILFGLAGMVSIKAIFYAPTICVIVLLRSIMTPSEGGITLQGALLKPILISVVSILSFTGFYFMHAHTVPTASSGIDYLNTVVGASLIEEGLFPRWDFFKLSVKRNIFHWAVILIGFGVLLKQMSNKNTRWTALLCLSFMLPILTLLFYTHAYSYYYLFMLAPTTIIMAAAYDTKFFNTEAIRNLLPIVLVFISVCFLIARGSQQSLKTQKQVIAVAHTLFPKGTAYIDRCAMISSAPKSGLFMSSWFMKNYYEENEPIFETVLRNEQPKYIVANIESLDLDNITDETRRRFLPDDEKVLKENYVHHWGPIYVAGKKVNLRVNQAMQTDILIPGVYTVEARASVKINDKVYVNGDVIEFIAGKHIIESSLGQNIVLRWGSNLPLPVLDAPDRPLFNGF